MANTGVLSLQLRPDSKAGTLGGLVEFLSHQPVRN
jgi:hypothetical protein